MNSERRTVLRFSFTATPHYKVILDSLFARHGTYRGFGAREVMVPGMPWVFYVSLLAFAAAQETAYHAGCGCCNTSDTCNCDCYHHDWVWAYIFFIVILPVLGCCVVYFWLYFDYSWWVNQYNRSAETNRTVSPKREQKQKNVPAQSENVELLKNPFRP
tara:strand:+ start:61 stop:537 length:477 start_codon:yes stop_codon:yes gene_type:complete